MFPAREKGLNSISSQNFSLARKQDHSASGPAGQFGFPLGFSCGLLLEMLHGHCPKKRQAETEMGQELQLLPSPGQALSGHHLDQARRHSRSMLLTNSVPNAGDSGPAALCSSRDHWRTGVLGHPTFQLTFPPSLSTSVLMFVADKKKSQLWKGRWTAGARALLFILTPPSHCRARQLSCMEQCGSPEPPVIYAQNTISPHITCLSPGVTQLLNLCVIFRDFRGI